MKIPRGVYEPRCEKNHDATRTPSGSKRDSGRRREDMVGERKHKIHHAENNRIQRVEEVLEQQEYSPPQ